MDRETEPYVAVSYFSSALIFPGMNLGGRFKSASAAVAVLSCEPSPVRSQSEGELRTNPVIQTQRMTLSRLVPMAADIEIKASKVGYDRYDPQS